MRIDFYSLSAVPLERVLPSICEKVLQAGERLLIVADDARLARLDEHLWSYSAESFLPHARRDRPNAGLQPILLSETLEPSNGASNLALADGVWRDEALAFARSFYFFDSTQLDAARAAWRALKNEASAETRYWKQDERGKWVQGP